MSKKKIIRIIIIIVLIIAIVFLLDLGRKVYILSKYSDKCNEYLQITNFYKKTNPEDGTTTEFWRKDNLGIFKRTSEDNIKMIYYGKDYNWIMIDNKDGNGIEIQTLPTQTLCMESFGDKIKMAFLSKITTEKFNNIDCYKIYLNKDWQLFINKNDLLVMKEINGSTDTGIIEYKINEVKDEEVSMPNLDGYTINDTTQQSN